MDLKEIVNRPDNLPVDQREAEYVLEKYIQKRKGMDVMIRLNIFYLLHEGPTFIKTFIKALIWFRENPEQQQ